MNNKSIFGEITKSETLEDGTLKILGCVSSGVVDAHGETIMPEAMKKAIPAYMEWATIKEMHKSDTASGVAKSLTVDDNGMTWLECIIADPVAILKVKTGTYKGFSIGGDQVVRDITNKSLITSFRLNEISLVDRPANPQAMISLFKADFKDNELEVDSVVDTPIIKAEETPAEVKKSLYDAARFATLLDELVCFQERIEINAKCEAVEDPMEPMSTIPDELKAVISTIAGLLNVYVAEQSKDLTDDLKPETNIENSNLQVNELEKLTTDLNNDTLNKAYLDKIELLEKSYNETISKLTSNNETLENRVKELESLPAPAKASLLAVSKNLEHTGEQEKEITPVYYPGTNTVNESATWMKKNMFGNK